MRVALLLPVMLSSCMFILDFDELQNGEPLATGGAAGSNGSGGEGESAGETGRGGSNGTSGAGGGGGGADCGAHPDILLRRGAAGQGHGRGHGKNHCFHASLLKVRPAAKATDVSLPDLTPGGQACFRGAYPRMP